MISELDVSTRAEGSGALSFIPGSNTPATARLGELCQRVRCSSMGESSFFETQSSAGSWHSVEEYPFSCLVSSASVPGRITAEIAPGAIYPTLDSIQQGLNVSQG